MIRVDIRASRSYGRCDQSAVMKSSVCTARRAIDVLVGPAVAHDADRLHRQQHRERLRRLAIPARLLAAPRGRSRRPARSTSSRSSVTSPRQRTARPGPGNGCRQTSVLRQAQLQAEPAHLVLEQVAERLDQLEAELLRQAADVVVRLDRRRRAVGGAAALDHVGVERALGQELGVLDALRLVLEHVDEHVADDLAASPAGR